MKKIKYIIICLILLLIVIAIVLFSLLSKKENVNLQESNTLDSVDAIVVDKFEKETNINTFFTKENTINMFLSYIYSQETNVPKDKILNGLLNEDYKAQNRNNRKYSI